MILPKAIRVTGRLLKYTEQYSSPSAFVSGQGKVKGRLINFSKTLDFSIPRLMAIYPLPKITTNYLGKVRWATAHCAPHKKFKGQVLCNFLGIQLGNRDPDCDLRFLDVAVLMRVYRSMLKTLLSYLECNSSTLFLGLKDAISDSELVSQPDIVERAYITEMYIASESNRNPLGALKTELINRGKIHLKTCRSLPE